MSSNSAAEDTTVVPTDASAVTPTKAKTEGEVGVTDLEPRKMSPGTESETDESYVEGESEDDYSDEDDEIGPEYEDENVDVKDAAVNVLNDLVELFIEKNGRAPNAEEVQQWIETFKSLEVDDGEGAGKEEEASAE